MASVIVQPKYPNDPLPEVVADFVAALSEAFPADSIEVVSEQPHAHQVTFHEVLTIWVPVAGGGVVPIIQAAIAVGKWLRKRHREDRGVRPRTVTICDSNGRVLRRISISSGEDSTPVEIEVAPNAECSLPPKLH